MEIIRRVPLLALALVPIAACSSKDALLHARDGGVDQAVGVGTGGAGGHPGTGGVFGVGGAAGTDGGTIVGGTGGRGDGGGTGGGNDGPGLGGTGGSSGAGGTGKDGGQPDTAGDAMPSADAPVSDDGPNCGPGYPVGSQRPQGDGCNTCYCESAGNWLCTTKQCPPAAEAGAEVGADAGQCPAGQIWCPGCTPGTGSCGVVCTGVACPAPDAGCEGNSCSAGDAPPATKDAADAETGSTACSQVTTEAECDGRGDCHSVYRSLGACGCAGAGCCMRFLSCADGAFATCTPPTAFGCTIATPGCDSPYVLSYTPGCYEGCVKPAECSQ